MKELLIPNSNPKSITNTTWLLYSNVIMWQNLTNFQTKTAQKSNHYQTFCNQSGWGFVKHLSVDDTCEQSQTPPAILASNFMNIVH